MISYELISLASGFLAAGAIGYIAAFRSDISELKKLHHKTQKDLILESAELLNASRKDLFEKTKDFDDITKKASAANTSQAQKIIELENTIAALDERISMLSGNATFTGAGKQTAWPQNPVKRT